MDFIQNIQATSKITLLEKKLSTLHEELSGHDVYKNLLNIQNLRVFMEYHVFAVWDFMTLLKGIQKNITCTQIPWRPSTYPKELVRLVNSMVLDEESDIDHNNEACDHFSLYVRAMEELGADSKPIKSFLKNLDIDQLTMPLREFVQFNITMAQSYPLHILVGVFYFGRENLIAKIFEPILENLKSFSHNTIPKSLIYYLQRHVELDGSTHSTQCKKLLETVCMDNPKSYQEALSFGIQACLLRKKLWDRALESMILYTPHSLPQISLF